MEYTNLGKSDLKVSRICMGCMGFGNAATGQHSWTVDETQTREIIKHGLDLGINFYDTAIAYQRTVRRACAQRFCKEGRLCDCHEVYATHAGGD